MINLKDFIELCNLEGLYSFVSVKEKENNFELILFNGPKTGYNFNRVEKYYNNIVINVNFNLNNNSIMIEVK